MTHGTKRTVNAKTWKHKRNSKDSMSQNLGREEGAAGAEGRSGEELLFDFQCHGKPLKSFMQRSKTISLMFLEALWATVESIECGGTRMTVRNQ